MTFQWEELTETFDGQIGLALLDIKLPDMEGGNLYPLIMAAGSNLKVTVFSGYGIEGLAGRFWMQVLRILSKHPFPLQFYQRN